MRGTDVSDSASDKVFHVYLKTASKVSPVIGGGGGLGALAGWGCEVEVESGDIAVRADNGVLGEVMYPGRSAGGEQADRVAFVVDPRRR